MGLVVSRKEGEAIIIGDDIKVTPLENDGTAHRLHIEAPKEVNIYREEVYEEYTNQEIKQFNFNPNIKSEKD